MLLYVLYVLCTQCTQSQRRTPPSSKTPGSGLGVMLISLASFFSIPTGCWTVLHNIFKRVTQTTCTRARADGWASDTDDSPTSFSVNSRALMRVLQIPLHSVTEPAARHQCPLDSVASYLIYADVRLRIPMTPHTDAGLHLCR